MTTYKVLDEIYAIPKKLWKDMPLYKSSRVMLSRNVKLLPEEYDSQIARAYKSKEAFDYIKSIAHKISFDYVKNEHDEFCVARFAPINKNYVCSYHDGPVEYEWNKHRNSVVKYKPRTVDVEKRQDKKDARRTQSLIAIAHNTQVVINELEVIKSKIANNTLTKEELTDVYYSYLKFIQKNKKYKNKL